MQFYTFLLIVSLASPTDDIIAINKPCGLPVHCKWIILNIICHGFVNYSTVYPVTSVVFQIFHFSASFTNQVSHYYIDYVFKLDRKIGFKSHISLIIFPRQAFFLQLQKLYLIFARLLSYSKMVAVSSRFSN